MRHCLARVVATISVCLVWPFAHGQDPAPSLIEGQPVAEVRFEPPDQPLTPEQLSRILPIKPGEPATIESVRTAIKELYATGRYAYVQVSAEPAPAGVSLVIEARPQWFVGPVEVEADLRSPPTLGQIANATRLQLGEPFTNEDLDAAVENIQDLLRRNGFFMGTVVPETTRDEEHQQIFFRFVVASGDRARLTLPLITGEPRLPHQNVAEAAGYRTWYRRWRPATRRNVQAGLQRIRNFFEEEDRLTARARLEDTMFDPRENHATPVIDVQGGPVVEIRTVGADIRRSRLRRYLPIFAAQEINRDLLVEGARNLRDHFQNEGYFGAEVDFRTVDVGPDEREIVYVVNRGPRQKLVDVIVKGNRYFDTESIRERMFLRPAGFLILRRGRFSEGLARRDEESITRLYEANGFRDVRVSIQTIEDYEGEPGNVAAVVAIEEGEQHLVSSLTVHGVETVDADYIVSRLSLQEGQPFSELNVGLDRNFILTEYQSAGYLDAAFEWRMEPGPGPREIRVEYFIAEGEQGFIRDVLITGMRVTSPSLVKPNLVLTSGDPLSWTELGRQQRLLYDLGVFTRVNMAIQNPQGGTRTKYVIYDLQEGHRYTAAVGGGAEFGRIGGGRTTRFDQPTGAAGFAPRVSFDASRLNMFGLGHHLNFKTRYSNINRRALLNYSAPRYMNVEGRRLSLTGMWDQTFDVRTFQARRLEGSVQVSQQISRPTTIFGRYTWRDARVDEESLKIEPLLIPLLAQPARVGMLAASLVQDRRDVPTDATRGIFSTADFGVSSRIFGSRQSFTRFIGRHARYYTVRRGWVLAAQTHLGVLNPFAIPAGTPRDQAVPLPERLFGGGGTSHRGFPDNQAGPRDLTTGFPIGGNAQLFHNTELRFPFLTDNIDGVFFHDLGNTFSRLGRISFRVNQRNLEDFDYMVHAAGFGIRYRTPVGPIRVDLAWSINPPQFMGFEGTREELLFGQGVRRLQRVSRFQFFFSIGQAF
jgi:outer membrane protein insertion porin family